MSKAGFYGIQARRNTLLFLTAFVVGDWELWQADEPQSTPAITRGAASQVTNTGSRRTLYLHTRAFLQSEHVGKLSGGD